MTAGGGGRRGGRKEAHASCMMGREKTEGETEKRQREREKRQRGRITEETGAAGTRPAGRESGAGFMRDKREGAHARAGSRSAEVRSSARAQGALRCKVPWCTVVNPRWFEWSRRPPPGWGGFRSVASGFLVVGTRLLRECFYTKETRE